MLFKKKTGDLKEALDAARGQVPVSRYIPYAVHTTPGIIKLRDNGDLCATWRLHGFTFETASVQEIASAKNQLVNFLHAVRGTDQAEPTALWVHRVRRKVSDQLPGYFPSAFAKQLDTKYWDSLASQSMLQNELYFTLLLRPTKGASGAVRKMRTKTAESMLQFDSEVHERFEILCQQVTASVSKYGGERLTTYEKTSATGNVLTLSPNLTFFKYLLTGVHEDVALQESGINEYLCDARIFAGDANGVVQVNHPVKRTYIGYLDLLDYPALSEPGMNNPLFYGDYEFVETQSFSFTNKREGIEALKLQQNRLISGGEGSPEQIQEMNAAIEDVNNGRVFLGEYHYTLGVYGETLSQAQKNMSTARTSLQEGPGYKVATIDVVPECAHFAQLPGNWTWRPREAKLTSRNFACMAPMHNFDMGKRDGNPWGQAVTIFQTPARQPYYLNLHQVAFGKNRQGEKDPGNTFVCGMTGTGKSVLMGFVLSQLTKVPKLRVLFFDKDRGAEVLIRALGGRYRQLKRGQPTGFNPFQWNPTASTIKFVEQLVMQCARRSSDEVLDIKIENAIISSVRRVFELPEKSTRRISAILQFVGEDSETGQRLGKWCRTRNKEGTNAWVLDNAQDTTNFDGCSIFGYDYTEFLSDEECGPIILGYILEAADTLINGDPFVYIMEEFAKMVAAKSQTLVEFARDKQTTIRKLNGAGIFVTQSPSQVNQYPIGTTLREQCVTQIFLPNPGADIADYVDGFKLSPAEFDAIKNLDVDSRMFLVKQGDRSAVCGLNLYGFDEELAVLTGTPESVAILDQLRAELQTDDPNVWMQPFQERLRQSKAATKKALIA
jgi:type IV secretion system protein VirB4